MKTLITSKITIAAAPAKTFRYLADLKCHQLWNPHLISIAPLMSLRLGVEYKTVSILLGVEVKGTNAVTKFKVNEELELSNTTGLLQYVVRYRLQSRGQKTLLNCTTVVSSKSNAFAFAAPILEILARRELQTDLSALKIAVEQRLTGA
jgi:hypothetical protein